MTAFQVSNDFQMDNIDSLTNDLLISRESPASQSAALNRGQQQYRNGSLNNFSPQKLQIDLADLLLEIERPAANGTRQLGLAPAIDALAVVLMLAGRGPHLFCLHEVVQADRAALSLLAPQHLLEVGRRVRYEKAAFLAISRERHEDLDAVCFLLFSALLPLRVMATVAVVAISLNLKLLELADSVMPRPVAFAEVDYNCTEYHDQEDHGGEDYGVAVVCILDVFIGFHADCDSLLGKLLGQRADSFLLRLVFDFDAVDFGVVVLILLLEHLQADNDLVILLVLLLQDADLMRGEDKAASGVDDELCGVNARVDGADDAVALLSLDVKQRGQQGGVEDHADLEGESVVADFIRLEVEVAEVGAQGGLPGLLEQRVRTNLAELADEVGRADADVGRGAVAAVEAAAQRLAGCGCYQNLQEHNGQNCALFHAIILQ